MYMNSSASSLIKHPCNQYQTHKHLCSCLTVGIKSGIIKTTCFKRGNRSQQSDYPYLDIHKPASLSVLPQTDFTLNDIKVI